MNQLYDRVYIVIYNRPIRSTNRINVAYLNRRAIYKKMQRIQNYGWGLFFFFFFFFFFFHLGRSTRDIFIASPTLSIDFVKKMGFFFYMYIYKYILFFTSVLLFFFHLFVEAFFLFIIVKIGCRRYARVEEKGWNHLMNMQKLLACVSAPFFPTPLLKW